MSTASKLSNEISIKTKNILGAIMTGFLPSQMNLFESSFKGGIDRGGKQKVEGVVAEILGRGEVLTQGRPQLSLSSCTYYKVLGKFHHLPEPWAEPGCHHWCLYNRTLLVASMQCQ
jgi:hypothetical protein